MNFFNLSLTSYVVTYELLLDELLPDDTILELLTYRSIGNISNDKNEYPKDLFFFSSSPSFLLNIKYEINADTIVMINAIINNIKLSLTLIVYLYPYVK